MLLDDNAEIERYIREGEPHDVAETDKEILTFDIPDDALERAAGAAPLVTLVPCTFHWPDCAWPQ